ncbi:hypothetical protein [Legionella tunisiensis]|uniref:hypothetical protein n=1 Tax=Legionella tunisiensis TaxID=1034944 RepID=UPI0012EA8DCC|nr:hypothetical protein [Legionella tunisiensis]
MGHYWLGLLKEARPNILFNVHIDTELFASMFADYSGSVIDGDSLTSIINRNMRYVYSKWIDSFDSTFRINNTV